MAMLSPTRITHVPRPADQPAPATEESVAEIIDVDRMQPNGMGTDRTKPVPENRVEERQQMQVPGPIDEPWPCDNSREAIHDRVANRQLGLRFGRLIDVRRVHR